jgi:hypothetical protein
MAPLWRRRPLPARRDAEVPEAATAWHTQVVLPVPIEFLRGVLGVLSLFFAYMAGRTYIAVRKGRVKLSRFYGWLLRAVLCALALALRHVIDTTAMVIWTLDVLLLAAGAWQATHEKKPEDLTHEIFPDESKQ